MYFKFCLGQINKKGEIKILDKSNIMNFLNMLACIQAQQISFAQVQNLIAK